MTRARVVAVLFCTGVFFAYGVFAYAAGKQGSEKLCPSGYMESETVSGGSSGATVKGRCVKKDTVTDDKGHVCANGAVAFPNITTGKVTRYCKDDLQLTRSSNFQVCDSVSRTCAASMSSRSGNAFNALVDTRRTYGVVDPYAGEDVPPDESLKQRSPETPSERFLHDLERISQADYVAPERRVRISADVPGVIVDPLSISRFRSTMRSDGMDGFADTPADTIERPAIWGHESTFSIPENANLAFAVARYPFTETREEPGQFGDVFFTKEGRPFMYRDTLSSDGLTGSSQLMFVVPDSSGGYELKPLTVDGGLTYDDIARTIQTRGEYNAFESAIGIDGANIPRQQPDWSFVLLSPDRTLGLFGEGQLRDAIRRGSEIYGLPERINALLDSTNEKLRLVYPEMQIGPTFTTERRWLNPADFGAFPTMAQYETLLSIVENEASKYPAEFWANPNTPASTFALLSNTDLKYPVGVMRTDDGVGIFNYTPIVTPEGGQATIHHEMWHNILVSQGLDGNAWGNSIYGPAANAAYIGNRWGELSETFAAWGLPRNMPGFTNMYGMVSGFEDSAITVQGMFTNFNDLEARARTDPILERKIDVIIGVAENLSGGRMNRDYFRNLQPLYFSSNPRNRPWSNEFRAAWWGEQLERGRLPLP